MGTHNIQLANFDMASFTRYLVSLGPVLSCRHIEWKEWGQASILDGRTLRIVSALCAA